MYNDDNYLMLSGLQHFSYCKRQWALIHIEQQWAENGRTADGNIFHKTAHDDQKTEKRGDKIIMRGLPIKSAKLGFTGICDVVEFNMSEDGVTLPGYVGTWCPYPVEYKVGEPKEYDADELQLCAQAICLEEMLCCEIDEGSLFYGRTRRRKRVLFTENMRDTISTMAAEMHDYWERGYTPRVKPKKGCNACSLKEICMPGLSRRANVKDYIQQSLELVTGDLES